MKHRIAFEQIENDWQNALPIGNGRMGAMVYQKEREIHIALNHYDIYYAMLPEYQGRGTVSTEKKRQFLEAWPQLKIDPRSHYTDTFNPRKPGSSPIYGGTTQPYSGEVVLVLSDVPVMKKSKLELLIEQSVVYWNGEIAGKPVNIEIYIPKNEDRLIVRYNEGIRQVEYRLPVQDQDPAPYRKTRTQGPDSGSIMASGAGITYGAMIYTEQGKGCCIRKDTVSIAIEEGKKGWLAALVSVDSVDKSFLRRPCPPSGEGWESYFNASQVHLPDSFLETLYYLQLYLMEASSGRGGRYSEQACGLNGLWDIRRPTLWGSMWYWDVNIQSAFAPVFITNHMELAKDFCNAYLQYGDRAKAFARDLYGIDGWALDYPHAFYNCIQPWCMQFLYRYYEYTGDREYLQNDLYPAMTSMFTFIRKRVRVVDGTIRVEPDISPEQGPVTVNSVITISTIRYFLEKYIAVLRELEQPVQEAETLIALLPEYPLTADGKAYRDSENAPEDLWLRHPSILMPIWPGEEVHGDSDTDTYNRWMEVLKYVQDHTEIGVFGYPWIAAAAARMGEGTAALRILYEKGIDYVIRSNGMAYEETERWVNYCGVTKPPLFLPAMMESTGGIVAAVCEMLLQYREGVIHLFPAVPNGKDRLQIRQGYIEEEIDHYAEPACWSNVHFRNLRTPNGCLVSAAMKNGLMTGFRLQALSEGVFHIQWEKEILTIPLQQGESYEYGVMEETEMVSPSVQCHVAHTHRRVYLGENRHSIFHKTLDAWLFGYGMGNHLQLSHMVPYKFDFGLPGKGSYDSVSHRQVSVSEWADIYYGGWISVDTGCDTVSYGIRRKDPTARMVQRKGPDALRCDFMQGSGSMIFGIRVPAGKYELLVISGDEDGEVHEALTILNNGLCAEIHKEAGYYAAEEMAVNLKNDGDILLEVKAKEGEAWKLNAVLLRKEHIF